MPHEIYPDVTHYDKIQARHINRTEERFANTPTLEDIGVAARFNPAATTYGGANDGTTDDTERIQAAIDDAISEGGVIELRGDWRITAPLDFSALAGANKPVMFRGFGAGNLFASATGGMTRIINDHNGPAITAYGATTPSDAPLFGLDLAGFTVELTQAIPGEYAIDLNYIIAQTRLADIYVYGDNLAGNGVRLLNMAHGQGTMERVIVRGFPAGTGIEVSVASEGDVTASFNSGNSMISACSVINALKGWFFNGPSNLLNSFALNALKAVNTTDITGSIGFHLQAGIELMTMLSPHAERFSTGFLIDGDANTILSPLSSFPTGTPDAASSGLHITGNYNVVHSARVSQTHYGAKLSGAAKDNFVSAYHGPYAPAPLTAMFLDSTANDQNTLIDFEATDGWFKRDHKGLMWWGADASAADTNLYRLGTSILRTDDRFIAASGLGVTLTAASGPVGTIIDKMPIYNTSGSLVGYIPVYDAIT